PERCVTGNGEGKPDDVGLARSPIAVQNRGCARRIHIARPLKVGWYQVVGSKRSVTRATRRFTLRESVPHDILLPFNDADEVSCRTRAIKCTRCRASFAPISPLSRHRNWFP